VTVTFPVTSPGPLLPLDAPLPQPRRYRLLDAANIADTADERWKAGAWVNGYPAGRPAAHDPCSDGTYRLKNAEATDARPLAGSFTVVVGGVCTARSIGPSLSEYNARLRLWFEAVEGQTVEAVFADGLAGSTLGAYLGDPNMEALNGGTAVTPTEGLALLEEEIARVGNGMIHVAPATATYWVSQYLIEAGRDNQMRTRLGTLVAVGAGYIDVVPDNYGAGLPPADTEWAFASGFVQIRRSEVTMLSNDYAQSLDRSSNEVTVYAERDYLLTWVGRQDTGDDNHIQAGVLIDRI